MALLHVEKSARRWPFPHWATAIVAGWLALVGVFEAIKTDDSTLCHLRRFSGLPCPTCGTSRAVRAAMDGRVVDAILHNPFMAAVGALASLWFVLHVGLGWSVRTNLGRRGRAITWAIIAAAFLVNWVYLIRRH